MRDKGLGIAIAFALIIFAFMWAQTNGFASQPVASTDITVRQTAPTVNDDIDRGFLPGHIWIDQTNTNTYIAIITTDGAANWNQIDVLTASLGSEYGNLYADDEATPAQTLSTAGAFEIIIAFDHAGGSTSGITIDTSDHDITIVNAGDYAITYSATFSGSANRVFHMSLFLDGVMLRPSDIHRTMNASGAVGVVASTTLIASVTAGQVIDLRAAPEVNGDSITVEHGAIVIIELPSS